MIATSTSRYFCTDHTWLSFATPNEEDFIALNALAGQSVSPLVTLYTFKTFQTFTSDFFSITAPAQ